MMNQVVAPARSPRTVFHLPLPQVHACAPSWLSPHLSLCPDAHNLRPPPSRLRPPRPPRNGRDQYWRTAEFERAPEAVLLRIVVTPQGQYAGVGIGLALNPPPIDP